MPQQNSFSANLQHATDAKKKAYFDDMIKKFVDTYVLNYASDSSRLLVGVTSNPGEDEVYNYACSFLMFGLLAHAIRDASKESDCDRQFMHWKFLLLQF